MRFPAESHVVCPRAAVNRKETRAHFLCGLAPGEARETPDKKWVLSSATHESSRVPPNVSTVSGKGSASKGEKNVVASSLGLCRVFQSKGMWGPGQGSPPCSALQQESSSSRVYQNHLNYPESLLHCCFSDPNARVSHSTDLWGWVTCILTCMPTKTYMG